MRFRYTLEILTIVALAAFCLVFLYTDATMKGAEFAGSDDVGSGLIAKLAGMPETRFHPLIPQWKPPSSEIESGLFALQAAIGGAIVGGIFGYWIGLAKKA